MATLREIFETNRFLTNVRARSMPIKLAFQLHALTTKIESAVKFLDEQQTILLQKYGDQQRPDVYQIKQGNFEVYRRELEELHAQKSEVELRRFLKYEDLEKMGDLSPDDVTACTRLLDLSTIPADNTV